MCASGRHFHDNVRNERFIVILLFQLSLTAHFRCTRVCVCTVHTDSPRVSIRHSERTEYLCSVQYVSIWIEYDIVAAFHIGIATQFTNYPLGCTYSVAISTSAQCRMCTIMCTMCCWCFRLVSASSAQMMDNSFLFASVHSSIFICMWRTKYSKWYSECHSAIEIDWQCSHFAFDCIMDERIRTVYVDTVQKYSTHRLAAPRSCISPCDTQFHSSAEGPYATMHDVRYTFLSLSSRPFFLNDSATTWNSHQNWFEILIFTNWRTVWSMLHVQHLEQRETRTRASEWVSVCVAN